RNVEEGVELLRHALRCRLDVVGAARDPVAHVRVVERALEQLGGRLDGGERVAQVMRGGGEELVARVQRALQVARQTLGFGARLDRGLVGAGEPPGERPAERADHGEDHRDHRASLEHLPLSTASTCGPSIFTSSLTDWSPRMKAWRSASITVRSMSGELIFDIRPWAKRSVGTGASPMRTAGLPSIIRAGLTGPLPCASRKCSAASAAACAK